MQETPNLEKFKSLSDHDKQIIGKFVNDDIHVEYGHDRKINIDNRLFEITELNEKTKGFYIWLSTYKQLDRETDKIIIPRLTLDWIVNTIGGKTKRSYEHRAIRDMLSSLEKANLIKTTTSPKDIDGMTVFDIELVGVTKKYEYFTQVFIGNVDMIMKAGKGLNAFKYCFVYAVIRSFITESKNQTKVVTMQGDIIRNRMKLSKNTYYNRLAWLKEHNIIGMFIVQMKNGYGNKKVLMSDVRDIDKLVTTIDDWKNRNAIVKVVS